MRSEKRNTLRVGAGRLVDFVSPADAFYRNPSIFQREFHPPIFADTIAVGRLRIVSQMFGKLQWLRSRRVESQFCKDSFSGIGRTFLEKLLCLRRVDNLHTSWLRGNAISFLEFVVGDKTAGFYIF